MELLCSYCCCSRKSHILRLLGIGTRTDMQYRCISARRRRKFGRKPFMGTGMDCQIGYLLHRILISSQVGQRQTMVQHRRITTAPSQLSLKWNKATTITSSRITLEEDRRMTTTMAAMSHRLAHISLLRIRHRLRLALKCDEVLSNDWM